MLDAQVGKGYLYHIWLHWKTCTCTMNHEHKSPAQVFSLADQCWNSGGSIMLRAEGERRKASQIKQLGIGEPLSIAAL